MKVEVIAVALSLTGAFAYAAIRARFTEHSRERRSSLREAAARRRLRSAGSPQEICEAIASALRANVIMVECAEGRTIVVAGSPWKIALQPLDDIAINGSFQSGRPSGAGTENSALSDWLFVPVEVQGCVVSVLAVAGRYCRRTFSPTDPLILEASMALSNVLDRGRHELQFALS